MPPGRNIERPERAEFKPLPPDLNIPHLIQTTPNFEHVVRIDARNINSSTMPDVEAYVHDHVIKKGLPLVIENWHLRSDFPSWIFCVQWLIENHGPDRINVRDLKSKEDIPMTFGHYLNNLRKLSSKFHPYNFDGSGKQQRLYAKDLDCPPVWRHTLSQILPESTFYLSPMADLMSSLPEAARAENMMCYVGHEGTYTPAHKEMCASLGQNIMVAASTEDEHPLNRVGAAGSEGSSVWFMMGREDREVIAEYWLAHLGHDLEVESHFASVEDLANAPFTVYIVEQKVGDYILVPPLAPHQVWNRGEYTVKAAWNRTTVDTLEFSIKESLPKARLVCRDEQYKNKAIIYKTLCQYLKALKPDNDSQSPEYIKALRSRGSLANDFVRLFNLFTNILLDQCFGAPGTGKDPEVDKIDNEYNVTCSFCRCNIWNRFLSCGKCVVQSDDGDDDCYDVCMECYARGRSCGCQSGLKWVEQEDWSELLDSHEAFRNMVIEIQGTVSSDTPKKFSDALVALPRKTIAKVCLEQNKLRPFIDVTKDPALESEDDAATIARKKKTGELLNCHVCKVRHERWRCAACSTPGCSKAYCYGNLWRAFDMDPADDVLVQFNWKCPFCLGICSCGACQKNPKMNPHHPRGTFLGADTKHVVDPRSVEILVDFKRGNLSWLKPGEVDPMTRLKRKRTEEQDGDDTVGSDSPKTSYSHSWSAINEDNGTSYEDTTLRSCSIPLDPVLARSMHEEETNGRETKEIHAEGCSDKNLSNDRNGPENSLLLGDKIGGGQYILSPEPLANHHPGKQTSPNDQVIEMEESRLQKGEARDIRVSGGGDVVQQARHNKLTLPSPSAMLAGALPTRHSSPEPPLDCSYVSTHINQHSYPYISSTENPYLRDRNCGSTNATGTPNEDSHLSTLEKNPIAFIAAAGLMQISNDHHHSSLPVPVPVPPPPPPPSPPWPYTHPSTTMAIANIQHDYHPGNHPGLSEASASGLGVGAMVVPESGDHVKDPSHVSSNSNIYSPVHTSQPHSLLSDPQVTPLYPRMSYTPMHTTPRPPPIPAPLPPSLVFSPNTESLKCQRKKASTVDHLGGGLPAVKVGDSGRDTLKLSWVKQQQKLAKERKRLRQVRKRTKLVVLKINSERLKELEDEWDAKKATTSTATQVPIIEVGDDLVTTDLILHPVKKPENQGQKKPITENTKTDSPLEPRKRVAPGWVEISDDEDTDQSSTTPGVIGTYDREDGEYRGWGARQFRKQRQTATAPLKRDRRVVSRRETLEEAFIKSNISEQGHITASRDPTAETTDHYNTATQQRVEYEQAVDVNAKEKAEGDIRAEKNLQAKAEQAQKIEEEEVMLAHKCNQAEEKEKHDAIQWKMEQERKRKEQVARAYRESKLCALKAAAGEDPFEIWDGSCDDLQDAVEELPRWPQERDFAVIINVPGLLDRGQYEPFFNLKCDDFSLNPGLSIDLNFPPLVHDPKLSPSLIRNKRHRRATKGSSMTTTPPIRSRTTAISTATTCSPVLVRTNHPRKPQPRKPREGDLYRSRRPCQPRGQKQAVLVHDEPAQPPKRGRPRSISSTCLKSPTKSKFQSTETRPNTPSRVSARKRNMLLQSYRFDTDEESHITRNANNSRETSGMIDLELSPGLGILMQERARQAKLREKEDQQKGAMRLDSETYGCHAHGLEIEEQLDINLEDEYNSRWRRRTEKW